MRHSTIAVTASLLVCLVVAALQAEGHAGQSDLIPRSVIFGNPEKTFPTISPDGKMMAYIAPVGGVLNVWVKTIGKDDDRAITRAASRSIFNFFWSGHSKRMMYLQDKAGNENWQLYDVDLESGVERSLTPYDSVQVQIVGHNKQYPTRLVIAMNKDNPELHDAYDLDLATGELKQVAKNPGNVLGWITDNYLQVKAGIAIHEGGGTDLLYRSSAAPEEWKSLVTWDSQDNTSEPICFNKDGNSVYMVDSRGANAARFVRMDVATGKIAVLAQDSLYDVGNVLINPDTYEPEAVSFIRDREEWQVLDPAIKKDFDAICNIHEGDLRILSRDAADRVWTIAFNVDDGPIPFYAFDRATGKAAFLFYSRPALEKYALARMEPISFTARDGLTVHGYLSCPPGVPKMNLPMVLNVHGGPWTRDTWGYNPEAQWLANRGYACLQVNFRGSAGYGKAFMAAGNREWGGKMQDDLIDAVKWAIAQGVADPKRIAIYGGSYGGYAALVGATFTPDVFAAAVDLTGPSNLVTYMEKMPPYWASAREIFYQRIGNPETEPEFLKSRSPLFKVDAIKIPILVAQGAKDPRVNKAESEQVVAAMEAKGIDHEYMVFDNEGHGLRMPESKMRFYGAVEKFLAKHIGGRYEE